MKYISIILFLFIGSYSVKGESFIDSTQSVYSEVLEREMPYSIYLPKNYDSSDKSYPVLYLLHGRWGDHTNWQVHGDLEETVLYLLKGDLISEMIIVMPDGLIDSFYINNFDGSVNWEDFFYDEFIPHVETEYRITAERESRSIAGLSMGGYGALYHAIKHPDMFVECYAFSPAVYEIEPIIYNDTRNKEAKKFQSTLWGPIGRDGFPKNYKIMSIQEICRKMSESEIDKLPKITIECGISDYLFNQNRHLILIMFKKRIDFELELREGAHNWYFWRSALRTGLISINKSFHSL